MKISNLLELSNLLLVEALSPNEEEELRGHLDVLRKAAAAGDKTIPADIKDMIDKYFAASGGAAPAGGTGGATGAAPAATSAGAGGTGTSGSGTTAAPAAPSGTPSAGAGAAPTAGGAGNITPDPKLDPNIARMKALAGTGGTPGGTVGAAGATPSAGERAKQAGIPYDPQVEWFQNRLLTIDKKNGNNKYQKLLGGFGPNKDGVDGKLGTYTTAAIQQYLKDNPQDADHPRLKPILDRYGNKLTLPSAQNTRRSLSGPDPELQWFQNRLLKIDKDAGNNTYEKLLGAAGADGYMTPETRAAINQYLKDNPQDANHARLKPILDQYNISAPIPMSGARMRELYRQATGVNAAVPTNSKPLQATEIYKRETGMEPLIAAPRDPNSPAEVLDRIKSKEYQDRKDREGPNPKIW